MGNTHKGTNGGSEATRAVALVGPAGTGKTSLAEAQSVVVDKAKAALVYKP